MSNTSVMHNTFVLERSYPVAAARLYAAFADPAKKRRWFADGGETHDVVDFQLDFRVGGREHTHYRMTKATPFPGVSLATEGIHLVIVPGSLIITASSMTMGDRTISAALVTAEIIGTVEGSKLILTHQGAFFEGSGGPEMREGGWRTLLDRLSKEMSLA